MKRFVYRIISKRASIANVELFPGHPIKIIATPADFEMLYPVIEKADLIGIDTEWKPLFMCISEKVGIIVFLYSFVGFSSFGAVGKISDNISVYFDRTVTMYEFMTELG